MTFLMERTGPEQAAALAFRSRPQESGHDARQVHPIPDSGPFETVPTHTAHHRVHSVQSHRVAPCDPYVRSMVSVLGWGCMLQEHFEPGPNPSRLLRAPIFSLARFNWSWENPTSRPALNRSG